MTDIASTTELSLYEGTFRAFGSNCRVVTDLKDGVERSVGRLEDLESRWSRFIPTSEICELNRRTGDWHSVSAITTELLTRAELSRRKTGGRFNPLMAEQLCMLGYDRSYELLQTASQANGSQANGAEVSPPPDAGIELSGSDVRLPLGCRVDPGGLGKGLAADLVVGDLLDAGATWAVVSLGGDIRFGGAALAESTQSVLVDDPRSTKTILGSTRVAGGAMATSSITGKRWQRDGETHHHLLDPTTGQPVALDRGYSRIAASVYAPTAWWADVVAKVLVIDPSIGPEQVAEWGCEAVAFTTTEVIELGLPVERSES